MAGDQVKKTRRRKYSLEVVFVVAFAVFLTLSIIAFMIKWVSPHLLQA